MTRWIEPQRGAAHYIRNRYKMAGHTSIQDLYLQSLHLPPFQEKWENDGQAFLQARVAIEKSTEQFTSFREAQNLYRSFEQTAKANPQNALAQYSWSLVALRFALANPRIINPNPQPNRDDAVESLTEPYRALQTVPSPHNYEFSRLRFIYAEVITEDPALIPLGKRLLQHDPKDYEVMRFLLPILSLNTSAEQKLATTYADTIIKWKPNNPGCNSVYAGVHMSIYFSTGNLHDKAAALNGYNNYLRLAPRDAYFRRIALIWIKRIRAN